MNSIIAVAAVFCNYIEANRCDVKFSIPHPCANISIKSETQYTVFESSAPMVGRGCFRVGDGVVERKTVKLVPADVWTPVAAAEAK